MHLPYVCVMVSARDFAVIRKWMSCLYLKNDVAQVEYFEEYLVSNPTTGDMLNAKTCKYALETYLYLIWGVASSPD